MNACHAIQGEGIVKILSILENKKVIIKVIDNGAGMSQSTQDKIFDPFFTTKPVGIGTGLGLSISFGIIKSCGGKIMVKSELNSGTEFQISLPVGNN